MRCNNCGWDNVPGATTCIKCGHPLNVENGYGGNAYHNPAPQQSYGGQQQMPRPTVIGAMGAQEPAPRPTVIGATGMQAPPPRPTRIGNAPQGAGPAPSVGGTRECPNCGYPVVGNFNSCPNCGTPVASAPAAKPKPQSVNLADLGIPDRVKCDKCGEEVSVEFSFCPKCGEKIHLPTVRAIRHKPTPKPKHCSLTLIPEEDENIPEQKKDYEGSSVILTRENTEPDNRTITSKEQAELCFEDDKWFIINKSEYGSTYIEANRKFEIQPGDIIVLGDRRFRFEAE